jgi:hypothetical protein
MTEHFDPMPVIKGLKDFQRKTVDYAFKQLYGPRRTKRFLVADEVGLGKTLVARGLIAKTIRHLQQEGVKRIDVVYVCSNADIARQNINRLNVTGKSEYNLPTRITLLPLHLRQLKERGTNFISFTPGTSFNLRSRGGQAQERAVLYRLLQHAWGKRGLGHKGVVALLESGAPVAFDYYVDRISGVGPGADKLDKDLADAFARELAIHEERATEKGERPLRERFLELAERLRRNPNQEWSARFSMIGELRTILARSCVNALEADLIILDEFQRFRDLLDGDSEAAELARHLFTGEETAEGPGVRVVLLSATPYKMYTLSDESDEDHYADFIRTARFLMGPREVVKFKDELRAFRQSLLHPGEADKQTLLERKRKVENRLRRYMVRTERLGVTADRNGMLEEPKRPAPTLLPSDLRAYIAAERVSRHLDAGDPLEYWKSGAYLLNFMQSYKLKRELRQACDDPVRRRELGAILNDDSDSLLPVADLEQYRPLDPGNARLRALIADAVDSDAWRLLWIPPAMPYYELGPPFDSPNLANFTKRLVFSSWNVVPEVIATVVSYEVERRMVREGRRRYTNTAEARKKIRPILRFGVKDGRPTGMSLFGILYPSPSLAKLGDPLALSRDVGGSDVPASREAVLERAEQRIRRALRPVLHGAPREGTADAAWYWAAPMLLDSAEGDWNSRWLSRRRVAEAWTGGDGSSDREESSLFAEHIAHARAVLLDPSVLGRPPDDLAAVLAKLAVGGPANCALRAFARVAQGSRDFTNEVARDGAAHVAWGLRTLFNVPEVMSLIRGKGTRADDEAYWIRVLDYCVNGNFQAVLSEYAHVLREALGFLTREAANIVPDMAAAMNEALSVRAANYTADDIRLDNGDVTLEPRKLRARYALRFGTQTAEDEAQLHRADVVRIAFNSPFWPFVLATTSVGQEGLDFHQYCHAVVHWNLPANPVDLEQREGRVHRYKGHAIRKNVASVHRQAAFRGGVTDPWEALFEAARKGRDAGVGDLVPYWIFAPEGGARIERYVPALPLSREIERLSQLKRSLAAYRMVFGQPRQEDLMEYVQKMTGEGREVDVAAMALDLSPR